jgi:hypothetical protein
MNVKPETQNRGFQPMGEPKPGETHGLTGIGTDLARQEPTGRGFGLVWNRADPFLRSNPRPPAGYPDALLTLMMAHNSDILGSPQSVVVGLVSCWMEPGGRTGERLEKKAVKAGNYTWWWWWWMNLICRFPKTSFFTRCISHIII